MNWDPFQVATDGVFCDAFGQATDGYFCEVGPTKQFGFTVGVDRQKRDMQDLTDILVLMRAAKVA